MFKKLFSFLFAPRQEPKRDVGSHFITRDEFDELFECRITSYLQRFAETQELMQKGNLCCFLLQSLKEAEDLKPTDPTEKATVDEFIRQTKLWLDLTRKIEQDKLL